VDFSIRPATEEDIPGICDLLSELFSIEADFEPDPVKQARGIGCMIDDPSGGTLLLVAESGGTVVGMATAQTLISTAEGGRVGFVEDVVVAREFRGQGIGSLMIEHLTNWAKEQKLKRLQLLADKENLPALTFYAGRQWNKTGLICLRKMV
jgi:GNAT superfamily N-acetyltransferase